jgi:Fe-S oxidoreductase
MFDPERCDRCGDCLVECQWMNIGRDQAVAWIDTMIAGGHTPALDQCLTCYACNEICPRGANPFDLIAELQEKHHSLSSVESARASAARYVFDKELTDVPRAERILDVCVFGKSDADLIQGELYHLPRVGGKPFFCWVLMSHIGAESIQRQYARELVDRLARTGAREVVCFHDDCYALLARLAPDYGIRVPFLPVHLSEYLVEYLKANRERIQPLDFKIAYQRPCASRHTPEKEHFLDELFGLVGVRRVEREFDRRRALCCSGIKMMLGKGDPRPDQEKNILDAKNAGAKALACLCPVCMHSLAAVAREHDLPLVFIGDLARMALGEIKALK